MAETTLKRIENKTFGPNETVILDGCVFINCAFDGCDMVYDGKYDTAQEGCTCPRNPNVLLYGSAQRTFKVLNSLGFKIIAPFGEKPQDIPKFTNEVQQAKVVLPWKATTDSCRWKSGARLPGFMKPGNRVGKLLQLWIARHRPSAGS